jgi:heme exporter protein C
MKTNPPWLIALDYGSALGLLAATLVILLYAPLEAVMGAVQKVFYFHVAAGWVGMLALLVAFMSSILYLAQNDPRWDWLAVSAVELGLGFMLINILSGMIWARPVWNTWWTWDPRLTTAAVMVLIYAAYFLLRQGFSQPDKRSRFAAVYAIVGFVSVPLTFISIRVFRTIHPVLLSAGDFGAAAAGGLSAPMLATLLLAMSSFTLLFFSFLSHRYRLQRASEQLAQLQGSVTDA